MRKMSKNRAEEDAVSSTNGSVEAEQEVTNGTESAGKDGAENDAGDSNDNNAATNGAPVGDSNEESGINSAAEEDGDARDPPKKRGRSKSKPKKEGEKKEGKKSARKSAVKSYAGDEDKDDEEEEEYEVEQIIESKKIRGKLHYLIRWKGYSAASDSWEPADTVNSPELIKKFEESEKTKSPKKATKRTSSPSKGGKAKKGKKSTKTYAKPKDKFDYENAESDQEWEVDRILDVHYKKSGQREFLVHWKGWSTKHDSWEPEENLFCNELINKFMSKVESAQSKSQKELRVAPSKTKRFTLQQKSTGRRLSKRQTQRQRVRYDDAE